MTRPDRRTLDAANTLTHLAEKEPMMDRPDDGLGHYSDCGHACPCYKAGADHFRNWDGLLSILDEVYPADVFTGVSGDPGPRIIVLLREINALRGDR